MSGEAEVAEKERICQANGSVLERPKVVNSA